MDGGEMLISTGTGVGPVFSVDVQTTPAFKGGTPRVLFVPWQDLTGIHATADPKRFLTVVP